MFTYLYVTRKPNQWRMTMNVTGSEQRFDTVVVGGGQAGLAVGYYLPIQGRDFVILEAHHQIGTSWRERWDRLRLFTSAWMSSLPEMPLSAPADAFLYRRSGKRRQVYS
jgi:putative flavoprotein involved in K+ transport